MPKASLTFTLPEESSEHHVAMKGQDLALVIWHLQQRIRNHLKYGEPGQGILANSPTQVLEAIRDELHSLMDEYNVWEAVEGP